MVGVSEARISQLASEGVIGRGGTAAAWLTAYCDRLRETAAGRVSADGELDLVRERAGLARAQRERVELQNALSRGEFAPIDVLGDALAKAIQVMVSELEQIDGLLVQTCPDLPEATRAAVLSCVAGARNKIAQRGPALVMAALDPGDDIDAEGDGGAG